MIIPWKFVRNSEVSELIQFPVIMEILDSVILEKNDFVNGITASASSSMSGFNVPFDEVLFLVVELSFLVGDILFLVVEVLFVVGEVSIIVVALLFCVDEVLFIIVALLFFAEKVLFLVDDLL